MNYRIRMDFQIHVGFVVSHIHIRNTIELTNGILMDLPVTLYKSSDFKTVSAIIGAFFVTFLHAKLVEL